MHIDKKVCRLCKDEKPINDFWKNSRRRDGRYTECKKCAYEKQQENLKKRLVVDPQYSNKRQQEWRKKGRNTLRKHLKQKYGMSLEEYDAMLLQQNGKCAVCDGELGGEHGGR